MTFDGHFPNPYDEPQETPPSPTPGCEALLAETPAVSPVLPSAEDLDAVEVERKIRNGGYGNGIT